MFRVALVGLWFALIGTGLYVVSGKTRDFAVASFRLVEPPPLSTLDPRLLDIVTLGFRGVYDDFLSIWAIQFLADERIRAYPHEEVYQAIKAISRQRPKIESIYMLSCFTLALDLGRPEYCKDIIIDGMNALPESWRLPVTQGFIFAYKMNDTENAAIFYTLAASRPGAPPFVKDLASRLTEKNQISVQDMQASLEEMFKGGKDEGGSRVGSFLNEMMMKKRSEEHAPGN